MEMENMLTFGNTKSVTNTEDSYEIFKQLIKEPFEVPKLPTFIQLKMPLNFKILSQAHCEVTSYL